VVNRTYNLFKDDKNLNKDIKIIGIGMGNSLDEIQSYRTSFKVEFPLISDTNKEIQNKLKMTVVPYMVLVDQKGKILLTHIGPIQNFDAFVSEIKKIYQTL
jgi:alkyl hydroperoxide reductase subunit AhpC